ncbi:Phosphopantetheine attachment site [Fontibacillus panacisegetis]|uniref:Phosphopantetheine attachment site n=1 Tax=Fontibacillus panacisegetis TaxID=670482 RepID=A0A1G7Q1A1_9BACL|nr:Phosphopantetheine attachment site [Fontibacillus panacisegetis]
MPYIQRILGVKSINGLRMYKENELYTKVVDFIGKVLNDLDYEGDISDELNLDSMNTIKIVVMLEDKFDVIFEDEELIFDNFKTIQSIVRLIESKIM